MSRSESRQRSALQSVRFSAADRLAVEARADAAGCSLSAFLRVKALRAEIADRLDQQLIEAYEKAGGQVVDAGRLLRAWLVGDDVSSVPVLDKHKGSSTEARLIAFLSAALTPLDSIAREAAPHRVAALGVEIEGDEEVSFSILPSDDGRVLGADEKRQKEEKGAPAAFRLLEDEKRDLKAIGGQALNLSELIRCAALDRPVQGLTDVFAIRRIQKVIADLGRVNGLLSWWLWDGRGKDGDRHVRGKAPEALKQQIFNIQKQIDHIQECLAAAQIDASGQAVTKRMADRLRERVAP